MFQQIIGKCENSSLNYELVEGQGLLKIDIPKARKTSLLLISHNSCEYIQEHDVKFYDFKCIEGYEAIWSSVHDVIECEVELPHRGFPFRRMFREHESLTEDGKWFIDTHIDGVQAEISEASKEFMIFELCRERGRIRPSFPIERLEKYRASTTTIKIHGCEIQHHDKALDIIETIFAAICFEFDCKTNMPLMLSTENTYPRGVPLKANTDFTLSKIGQKYDSEALSLYWYAQSAIGMPLLRYLAFYQVVEFYYPIYSELAAQKKVSNLLKDPCFNSHSQKDIAKIFNIVKAADSSRSELSQLEATIKECVDPRILREWLTSDSRREEYFRSKNAVKLSTFKIFSTAEDDDLLSQMWQRFYNIRCRIVHTKGAEGDLEVLHPQSKEIKHLEHEIELAKFLAHKLLIASSKPLGAV
ncbi:hypothetical protein ACED56_12280 [Vibrio splendidus]|uniref:hypothetical protein n=1 Tax=Vibrio splendidus TaxID=29497 RepID=UPI00352EFEDE